MLISELVNSILKPSNKENDLLLREVTEQQIIALYADFVRRDVNKYKIVPQALIQKIKCVSLNKVSNYACGEGTGLVLETNTIPKPISIPRLLPFISVFIDFKDRRRKEFGYIPPEELSFIENRRFNKHSFFYTYEDNKIILPQFDYPYEYISIRGLFTDPREAKKFAKEEAVKCNLCESINDSCADDNEESGCFENGEFDINNEYASLILSSYGQQTRPVESNNSDS